jgi:hypothetical protein
MDAHRLTTIEQLRAIIGEESPVVRTKLFRDLDPTAIEFIKHSPLLLLATSDRDGKPDVSPKGDAPGFVTVDEQQNLLIPDRKGNKLIFALQNILVNPRGRVAVPGPRHGGDATRAWLRRADGGAGGPRAPVGTRSAGTGRDPGPRRMLLLSLREGVQAFASLAARLLAA